MKQSLFPHIAQPIPANRMAARGILAGGLAVALLAVAASPARAQHDEVVSGVYVGDSAHETVNESYVGDGIGRRYGQPDLFYNYYTSGPFNQANAQMYVSPLPVPPNVGHTFNTYQPFYPHHMMYWHKDTFHNYYDNGRGMNRTRATYYSPPIRQAASNFYWNVLRLPR